MYEARTRFAEIVAAAEAGQEVIIARAGRPVARLVPVAARPGPRRPGALAGRLRIADDFDEPLPEGWFTETEP
jgi:prevent-host-death family protein